MKKIWLISILGIILLLSGVCYSLIELESSLKYEKTFKIWEVRIYSNGILIHKDTTQNAVNYTKSGVSFYNKEGFQIISENISFVLEEKSL